MGRLNRNPATLASVRIVTGDVVSLARFYEKITGIAPAGTENYVELDMSGTAIAICSQDAINMFSASAARPAANHSLIIDVEVVDVDRERSRIEPVVRNFIMEPKDQPWGTRSMLFRDPDGNLINFFSPIEGRK